MATVNLAFCPEGRQIWLIIINIIDGLMLLTTTPAIYYLIVAYIQQLKSKLPPKIPTKETNKDSRTLFSIGLLFMIVTFLVLLFNLLAGVYKCSTNHQKIYHAFEPPVTVSYAIQFYLLLLLLFIRLYNVFKGTMYALSQITVKIFCIMYILLPPLGVTAALFFVLQISGGFILTMIAFLIVITLIISLMIMYIRKLLRIYRSVAITDCPDTDELIITITKTTILTLLSLSVTFVTPIVIISDTQAAIGNVVTSTMLLDIYTNFLCITLSYSFFFGMYMKICGCMHRICKKMWYVFAGSKQIEDKFNLGSEIASASPTSPPSSM